MEGRNCTECRQIAPVPPITTTGPTTGHVATAELNCTTLDAPLLLDSFRGSSANMGSPYHVVVSPGGQYAYVTGHRSNSLAVVDVATDPKNPALVGSIVDASILAGPGGMSTSPDGRLLYVVGFRSDSLAVVNVTDASAPKIVGYTQHTALDGAWKVATSADGTAVYVAASLAKSLTIVNVANSSSPAVVAATTDTTCIGGAFGVGTSPDGRFAYVTSPTLDAFAVVDVQSPASPSVTGCIKGAASMDAPNDVAVSADGHLAFVPLHNSKTLVIVNVTDGHNPVIVSTITVGLKATAVAVSPDGRNVMVSNYYGDSVSFVDVQTPLTPQTHATVYLSGDINGPTGTAFSPDGRFAYATGWDDLLYVFEVAHCAK